jgi:hypothetical protein
VILVGIDPGSAHLGLVVVEALSSDAARTMCVAFTGSPGAVVRGEPRTLPVVAERPDIVTCAVLDFAASVGAERLVVEHSRWFPRAGASPASLMASQRAHEVCHDIVRELQRESPVPVEVIPRQTWAHRVVPRHRGGIGDALVAAALPALLEGARLLADVHQRDAAGAVLGVLLAPPPKVRRAPRPKGPRKPGRARRSRVGVELPSNVRRAEARAAARKAAGCICPPRGRPLRTCPAPHKRAAA